MSNVKAHSVITQSSLKTLDDIEDKKSISWKDFGTYLSQKINTQIKPETARQSGFPSILSKFAPDSSLLSSVIKYKICKNCKRPIGERNLNSHYSRCVELKNQKEEEPKTLSMAGIPVKQKRGRAANVISEGQTSVDSSRNSTPISASPGLNLTSTGRPRKKYKKSQTQKEKEAANAAAAAAAAASASDSSLGSGNLKKKKQLKAKVPVKTKGPIDVEKQCGVPLPSGGVCARSLTCKTHSMGAKRAVPGRSAPYDVLLQQYQKRNQAKLAANNALAAQRRENEEYNESLDYAGDGTSANGGVNRILDPDEETHMVLEGIAKSYAIPLERKVILPTRNRHNFLQMREAYANALISFGNNNNSQSNSASEQTLANQAISGSIGGIQGRCALVNVDSTTNSDDDCITQRGASIIGEIYQVRAPSKAILLTAQYNQMQQQLFQQQLMKFQQQQQQMLLAKQKLARESLQQK